MPIKGHKVSSEERLSDSRN